jgi:hypothetical protein
MAEAPAEVAALAFLAQNRWMPGVKVAAATSIGKAPVLAKFRPWESGEPGPKSGRPIRSSAAMAFVPFEG